MGALHTSQQRNCCSKKVWNMKTFKEFNESAEKIEKFQHELHELPVSSSERVQDMFFIMHEDKFTCFIPRYTSETHKKNYKLDPKNLGKGYVWFYLDENSKFHSDVNSTDMKVFGLLIERGVEHNKNIMSDKIFSKWWKKMNMELTYKKFNL